MKPREGRKETDSGNESLFKQIVPPFICAGMGMYVYVPKVQHIVIYDILR